MPPSVRVVSAKESAARDLAVIQNGTPSRVLMQRAGVGAANEIRKRFATGVAKGTVVYTGSGNNGGDGWVVAGALAREGFPVRVQEVAVASTSDSTAEKEAALSVLKTAVDIEPAIVVDALLGTGSEGEPRGKIGQAVKEINDLRRQGSRVVSLDVPSGLNATTGEHGSCVFADLTLSFGGVKRGSLVARDCNGEIEVIDIGLEDADAGEVSPPASALPIFVDSKWVFSRIPPIHFNAHKGTRKHLAVVGGASGMAGAIVLATRAALRSGIGLVRAVVERQTLAAITEAVPAALTSAWTMDEATLTREILSWANAIVIGPGLGKSADATELLRGVVGSATVPLLLDADAINSFASDASSLAKVLAGRMALLTPHPAEFARLAGVEVKDVLDQRFDIGTELARQTGATILLKGVPTTVFTPTGERYVIARGNAALATGGSGDVLSGIAGTLLAQTGDPVSAACCAAWIHGRAAELCEYVRGTTLDDVLFALPRVWNEPEPDPVLPVIARLPALR